MIATTIAAFLLGTAIFYAAYKLGKWVSEGEMLSLEEQNARLRDQVSFVQADCDHLRKLLARRVAEAHVTVADDQVSAMRLRKPATIPSEALSSLCNHNIPLWEPCGECIGVNEMTDPSDDTFAGRTALGLCFHGVSLSDHCDECARRNFVARGVVN